MESAQSGEYITIGKLLKPFGLKGEIKAIPDCDDPKRHTLLKKVFLEKNPARPFPMIVSQSRLHMGLWYLKFKGIDTPEDAKPYSNHQLLIDRADRPPLKDNKIYMSDIVGYEVMDADGKTLGTIASVENMPGQDLIVIENQSPKPILVPWIKEYVLEINEANRRLIIQYAPLKKLYEN